MYTLHKNKQPGVIADDICNLSTWIPDGTLWVCATYSETLALQNEGTHYLGSDFILVHVNIKIILFYENFLQHTCSVFVCFFMVEG